ncbi:MAG: HAMP domain-containing histidine kinase [Epsilonproteobacteria bacterium]|nr:HAMP domain-containing histidine kinase [Campylobacterota bacterium]
MIELFLAFIFYHYYKIEEEHLRESIYYEMKNYSFFFDDDKFEIDIIPKRESSKLYELYMNEELLFILVPIGESLDDLLQVYYPRSGYDLMLDKIREMIIWQFFFLSLVALLISLIFSFYALTPMRNALHLLEEFIKDIIHDLNTPITSILINLKMMDQSNDEVKSIEHSAKTISMLHKNLDNYLRESKLQQEELSIQTVLQEQIHFFKSSYDYLTWDIEIEEFTLYSDRNSLSRIIYNLLSNACRYNKSNGFIKVQAKKYSITISNSSYGIKAPHRIFERFYKESERGLGIGLHIVQKLCEELGIAKSVDMKEDIFTIVLQLPQK